MDEQNEKTHQRLSIADLEALCFDSLTRLQAQAHQAKPLARRIARAEAEGDQNAGMRYLLRCLEDLTLGRVDGAALPVLQHQNGVHLRCDIAHGFLPAAIDHALPRFLDVVDAQGAGFLGLCNGHSTAFMAQLAEDIAKRGFVALAMSTDYPCISLTPMAAPSLGRNPMALAVPEQQGQSILIFEQGQTLLTYEDVEHMIKQGKILPPDAALDDQGRTTQNPRAALDGSLLPLRGDYGFGLAVMVELYVLAILGAGASAQIAERSDPSDGPMRIGHCLLALKPQSYGQGGALDQFIQRLVTEAPEQLHALRRRQRFETALAEGVLVPQALLERIIAA